MALAAATVAKSANVGVAAGLAGWSMALLAGRASVGDFSVTVTEPRLVVPYLLFSVCCGVVILVATRRTAGYR